MSVIAVMSVYDEEALIARAIDSLWAIGVDFIHVFDGAWEGFGPGPSQDRTMEIAERLGCVAHWRGKPWPSQEAKRTAMFRQCGAQDGDFVLVADADEVWEGRLPEQGEASHMNVMVRCVGGNDLPGIRGEWPAGDYSTDYKPELRCFYWNDTLECAWPGGYLDHDSFIEPYHDLADWPITGPSRLPVLEGVRFDHHGAARSPERIAQKTAYYQAEHPKRAAWQRAMRSAYA